MEQSTASIQSSGSSGVILVNPASPERSELDQGKSNSDQVETKEILSPLRSDPGQAVQDDKNLAEAGMTVLPADDLLAFVQKHGIEEGFGYVVHGMTQDETKGTQEPEEIASPAGRDRNDELESLELQKQASELQERIFELTEGQEDLRKHMAEIIRNSMLAAEINKATVVLLYELVQKLYEEEEDEKRKNSWFAILMRITGFLTTSVMAGPEEGEKVLHAKKQ